MHRTIKIVRWTQDVTDRAIKMRQDGYSSSEIADELGFTRNAIIGRLRRLGVPGVLKQGGGGRPALYSPEELAERRKHRHATYWEQYGHRYREQKRLRYQRMTPEERREYNTRYNRAKRPRPPTAPRVPRVIPIPSPETNCTFSGLTAANCHFPTGHVGEPGFFFCGAPKEEGSYCGYHYDICYKSSPREGPRFQRRYSIAGRWK